MGYIKHHAIIITSDENNLEKIRDKCIAREMSVSEIVESKTNGYFSLFIAPDGSKEGWLTSDKGDINREFIKRMIPYGEWVEVSYGNEDGQARITDSRWSEL